MRFERRNYFRDHAHEIQRQQKVEWKIGSSQIHGRNEQLYHQEIMIW